MNYKLTQADYQKEWNETIFSIKKLCELYDGGEQSFAKDIATKLRVLFHESTSSQSLISKLRYSSNFVLLSTAYLYTPSNLMSSWELLSLTHGLDTFAFQPILNSNSGRLFYLEYPDWWNEVIFDDKINVFTRKEIVLLVANKLGGAHIDGVIPEKSANLVKYNSLGWVDDKGNAPTNNPAFCAVRQIAYEIIKSYDINKRKLLKRVHVKDRAFEMRFIDNKARFKWSSTDLQVSPETQAIVDQYRKESRKLFLYYFDNERIECIE